MSKKIVSPANGKFTIHGKDNRNLELTLDDRDLNKYIVEEMDGSDITSKLPSSTPSDINWFACFSVYNNANGKKGGYAKVKYSFKVRVDPGQELYIAYGGKAYNVTTEIQKNGKVTLSEGDPAIGSKP
jgi:hypothetical protein